MEGSKAVIHPSQSPSSAHLLHSYPLSLICIFLAILPHKPLQGKIKNKKFSRTGSLKSSGEMVYHSFHGGARAWAMASLLHSAVRFLPQMPSVISADPILFALIDSVWL